MDIRRHPGWRSAWAAGGFRATLLSAAAAGVALVLVLPRFFEWVGGRPGIRPADPVLAHWGPMDVSVPTFAVLYGTILLVAVSVAGRPWRLLRGLWAYILLMVMRMAAMALVALEPPGDIIPLADPVTLHFYPGAVPFLKDLFFSGHTATLVLTALLAEKGPVRWLAAAGAAVVGVLVLAQHVHWTVDVLAAVPAAWLAWVLAGRSLRRLGPVPSPPGA